MQKRYQMCIRVQRRNLGWRRSLRSLFLTFPRRWLCEKASSKYRGNAITSRKRISLPRTKGCLSRNCRHHRDSTRQDLKRREYATDWFRGTPGLRERACQLSCEPRNVLDDEGCQFSSDFRGRRTRNAKTSKVMSRSLQFRNRVEFLGELQRTRVGRSTEHDASGSDAFAMGGDCRAGCHRTHDARRRGDCFRYRRSWGKWSAKRDCVSKRVIQRLSTTCLRDVIERTRHSGHR